jgi:hypothetical protein
VSKEFKSYTIALGTTTKSVPVKAHNSIRIVERYHGPLRRVYSIINTELLDLGKNKKLQMAFKALNDSIGPDGLVPTLLVYGAWPCIVKSDVSNLTVI